VAIDELRPLPMPFRNPNKKEKYGSMSKFITGLMVSFFLHEIFIKYQSVRFKFYFFFVKSLLT
jgi:hypothetical protein